MQEKHKKNNMTNARDACNAGAHLIRIRFWVCYAMYVAEADKGLIWVILQASSVNTWKWESPKKGGPITVPNIEIYGFRV